MHVKEISLQCEMIFEELSVAKEKKLTLWMLLQFGH
jgi:hypothetical protein